MLLSADVDLPLKNLPDEDALTLLKEAIGSERVEKEDAPSRDLINKCNYEPLALQLASAALANRPHLQLSLVTDLVANAAGTWVTRPPAHLSHAESLDTPYGLLPEDEQHALRCIGAIGTARFTSWALAAMLGKNDDEGEDEARALAARLRARSTGSRKEFARPRGATTPGSPAPTTVRPHKPGTQSTKPLMCRTLNSQ